MEAVTIPSWFMWIVNAFMLIAVPWAIWITRQAFKNDKDIAVNTANDAKVEQELTKINILITESKNDTNARFDKIDNRFQKLDEKLDQFLIQGTIFLSREVEFMKNIMSK